MCGELKEVVLTVEKTLDPRFLRGSGPGNVIGIVRNMAQSM